MHGAEAANCPIETPESGQDFGGGGGLGKGHISFFSFLSLLPPPPPLPFLPFTPILKKKKKKEKAQMCVGTHTEPNKPTRCATPSRSPRCLPLPPPLLSVRARGWEGGEGGERGLFYFFTSSRPRGSVVCSL